MIKKTKPIFPYIEQNDACVTLASSISALVTEPQQKKVSLPYHKWQDSKNQTSKHTIKQNYPISINSLANILINTFISILRHKKERRVENIQTLTFLFSPRKLTAEMVKYKVRSRAFHPVILSLFNCSRTGSISQTFTAYPAPQGIDLLVVLHQRKDNTGAENLAGYLTECQCTVQKCTSGYK